MNPLRSRPVATLVRMLQLRSCGLAAACLLVSAGVQASSAGDTSPDAVSSIDPGLRQSFNRLIERYESVDMAVAEATAEAAEAPPTAAGSPLIQAEDYPSALEKGDFFRGMGDSRLAVQAYLDVLNHIDSTEQQQKRALIGLANVYFERGSLAHSVSLLEKYIQHFPQDERRPEILFQIGLMYREMGLNREASAVFYRVLNSIVVTREVNLDRYLALARRAQFEIARSHYDNADWQQALILFDRINLLELNPIDRETVLYYKAHATLRSGDLQAGLSLVERFLADFPRSPLVPEMLYTKARTHNQLQQTEDASRTLMRLLETAGQSDADLGREWLYWRQQAGNEFANQFYQSEDFLAAVRIYQGMAALSDEAEWQLPIIYQIGLCFEKLDLYDRAEESFAFVVDGLDRLTSRNGALNAGLEQLRRNAIWRREMLVWRKNLQRLADRQGAK